ncbi:CDKA1 protein, partial [Polypterus senegalus]
MWRRGEQPSASWDSRPDFGEFNLLECQVKQQRQSWGTNSVGNVHSPSTSLGVSAQSYRPLVNDYGPPSLGFSQGNSGNQVPQSKYAELLAIIEELGKEIRPTYAGSKSAMERLKRETSMHNGQSLRVKNGLAKLLGSHCDILERSIGKLLLTDESIMY